MVGEGQTNMKMWDVEISVRLRVEAKDGEEAKNKACKLVFDGLSEHLVVQFPDYFPREVEVPGRSGSPEDRGL